MDAKMQRLVQDLKSADIFASCSATDIARIIPYLQERTLRAGDVLFEAGSPATTFYLVSSGTVALLTGKKTTQEISTGTIGEESVYEERYLSDAIAVTDATVYAIDREHLRYVLGSGAGFMQALYRSIINHHVVRSLAGALRPTRVEAAPERPDRLKIIGWVLAIALPVVILLAGGGWGMDWKTKIFATVAVSTIVMWIFRLAHEFIPSIFAVLVILILDIAPPEVALSGFTSGSFFMALSIFGLSAVLVSSGLTYRLVVTLLRFVPRSKFWYNMTIMLVGIFLTPLMPSANGRISLANPILVDMVDSLGYRKGGRAATDLSVATFSGFTLFSGIFLSSKSIHFVIFGLLPIQVQEQFNWGYWLYASLVVGVVLLALHVVVSKYLFANDEPTNLSRERVETQQQVLGPMSTHEWAALGGIVLFLLGIATSTIHKIDLSWIGLTVLYVVLALEFLSKKEFTGSIDWTFLIFLGTLIGLVKSMSYIGLDAGIGKHLLWFGMYTRTNFALFVLLLGASILVLRFFIPNNATVAILAAIFLPIAEISGVNPWVVGYIILFMSDAWLLPYQCTYYLQFEELAHKDGIYDSRLFLKYNAISVLFRFAAVYASIPFWKYLGIL
ncbi:MAG TPA: SLC13 family permease [Spirochaetota bacterium]|nr:SLC13 family permease [Spirochaetota bacterium]